MIEIREDFKSGPLIALFSSQAHKFEWERATEGRNRVFFRDPEGLWYQKEIPCILGYLRGVSLTVGCSRGGYAALLVAHLLGCKSLTFAPQTILEDKRWPDIEKARQISNYPDLSFISGSQHKIYYCKHKPSDRFHAERLDVSLFPVECDTHGIAAYLKHRGRLPNFD